MKAVNPMLDGLEQVLLGAMMNGSADLPIHEDDFASQPNRKIYRCLTSLTNHALLAVQAELQRRGELKAVGGPARLTEISCLPHDAENVEYALGEVLEASRQRQSAKVGEQLRKGEIGLVGALKQLEKLSQYGAQENSWDIALALSTVTTLELHSLKITPRKKLLGDWFCEGDLGFIFAFRGTGKTWFAVAMANALSTAGKFGEWPAYEAVPVGYLDSEMPLDKMRERLDGLGRNKNLHLLHHDILFERANKVFNIANPEIQNAITSWCLKYGIKVLFIDNLSTAAFGVKENEADSWEKMIPWLLELRRRQISAIIIHHAGRSGEMRGTTKREDAVSWIIALDNTKQDAEDKRGARFISRFTKESRNTQEEIPAYEWHFVTEPGGEISIACKQARTLQVFRRIIEAGVTKPIEIAKEMKLPDYTISRMAHKAVKEGWLTKSKRGEYELVAGK